MADHGVRSGVQVSTWAGDMDCSVCRRKRLPASAFSRSMCAKRQKDVDAALKCKDCVEQQAQDERRIAAAKAASATAAAAATPEDAGGSSHECAACKQSLPAHAFSRAQLNNKGHGVQRCALCLAAADASERKAAEEKQAATLREARAGAKLAAASGSAASTLAAAATEAAVEAQMVTGLKPKRIGGGGRGRGGRGSNPNSRLFGGGRVSSSSALK